VSSLDGFRLDGKIAVVTGASGKLGPTWSRALIEAGARVAALDLPDSVATESMQILAREAGAALVRIDADVTSRASLDAAALRVRAELGDADVLVNNAGIDAPPGELAQTFTLENHDARAFLRTLEVNILGAFQCSQVFGAAMVTRKRGSIINIGSLYAEVSPDARFYDHFSKEPPFLKPPAYGASKAALINLTRYLATHWGPSGVRINALSPGGVEGGQDADFKRKFIARVPIGRMCAHGDLVGPLVFLASDASQYVTGTEVLVDGGFRAW
jgi:NAD(P)-dependent dehydrogenase (short-subunit alcohol dehydrogenase family)